MSEFNLSPKYIAFLKHDANVEFLEGTTAAAKTTTGIVKYLLKVAESDKQMHILSGLDKGTLEKNVINKDYGILDVFGDLIEYNPQGKGKHSMAHLIYHTAKGDKVIYVLGYDDRTRWKKALGGQYGCLFIDEINIADIEYIRESSMRCDYMIATLNPDNPSLDVYKEFINHSRPLPECANDAPAELTAMLDEPHKEGWTWWYFCFDDNAGLSEQKKQQIISMVPPGTKLYKNKILGLRGRSTGLVFSNFDRKRHVITKEEAKKRKYIMFTAGLDTAYSSKSPDTIAMLFQGITDNRELIMLDERVYDNRAQQTPLAPSDTVVNFADFLERNRKEWGLARNVFIDSADQATITECNKYRRNNPCIYVFNGAYKKVQIIDRINLVLGWLHHDKYLVVDSCKEHIKELELYSWREDKDNMPEDCNNHTIDASCYGWIPYQGMIGINEN